MLQNIRTETEIFAELAALTVLPGYAHVIAEICYRDQSVHYSKELKASDMECIFRNNRLIRTEITTLIGLMVRQQLDLTELSENDLAMYVAKTDSLMNELHGALCLPMYSNDPSSKGDSFWQGNLMREPIFYGGESAYPFQYRDLLCEKYRADDVWLTQKMGFSISQAKIIAQAICGLMDVKSNTMKPQRMGKTLQSWLPANEFSLCEIAEYSELDINVVSAFINALTLKSDNEKFTSLGSFNEAAAAPLIPTGRETFLLFQHYDIYEALYESPFFWMMKDKPYNRVAPVNRGAFTEQYSAKRLAAVFGSESVHTNVKLYKRREKDESGEVDVLVVFGDRIIIIQAKSKKLTLEARKGNDSKLEEDFAKAIQESYNQGWACANHILAGCRLVNDQRQELQLPKTIKEVYIFNVVSEHYPALAFQARKYLEYKTTNVIRAPFVMDVFLLDVMAEMLDSPLKFLNYIRTRLGCIEKVSVSHELVVLGAYLSGSLYNNGVFTVLDDSCKVHLDTAMLVRRDGLNGEHTPPGILTQIRGDLYEQLIAELEDFSASESAATELGFLLSSLPKSACEELNKVLVDITTKTSNTGTPCDIFFLLKYANSGICLRCNPSDNKDAEEKLKFDCMIRKYRERVQTWFGVSLNPLGEIQFVVMQDYSWAYVAEVERIACDI